MELVHRGGGDKGEEDGIDGGRQAERAGADGIEHQVPAEVDVPDAGVGAAFDQHHAEQVHAARGAAHPEKKPDAAAAEHAANEAARELVAGENVGARNEGEKQRCAGDGQKRFEDHAVVEPPPRQNQHGKVDGIVDETCNVNCRRPAGCAQKEGPKQLRKTHDAAGVESCRDDEEVHAERIQKRSAENAQTVQKLGCRKKLLLHG